MTAQGFRPRGFSSIYWTLLHLIDEGCSVSLEEANHHLEAGDTLDWLAELAGEWETQTGVMRLVLERPEFREEVDDFLQRHHNAVSAGDVGVSNNGLCLLLGYCLNEMQGLLINATQDS